MMHPVLYLFFVHIIADWALQSSWMAENKGKYWIVMSAHCIVWTGCLCISMHHLGMYAPWKALFLVIGHSFIDTWKCMVYAKVPLCQQKNLKHLYIDQFLHILQVFIVGVF